MEILSKNTERINVVDALRGFALVSIMLLHNIEKFEVYALVENLPAWMNNIDPAIWDSFFFLFGGKSYAIFALLFGLTFFIQTSNQEKSGKDFRVRFAWRLILLMGFGVLNTLFYQGEILILYSLVGFLLIPFTKWSNKAILISALVLLFQPILCFKLIIAINNPELAPATPMFMEYYDKVGEALKGDSILLLMKSNITNGRVASLLWFWEVGRVEQTLGLFLLGFLAGRKRIFYQTPETTKFWIKSLVISGILFVPLFYFKSNPDIFSNSQNISTSLGTIITLWSNLAFTTVLISSFVLLFNQTKVKPILNKLSPIGKMSLTNYIIQSILGSSIYYGFGLGMYKYTGATYCLIIGIALAITQGIFSAYWFKKHKRGPLEELWSKLTWLGAK